MRSHHGMILTLNSYPAKREQCTVTFGTGLREMAPLTRMSTYIFAFISISKPNRDIPKVAKEKTLNCLQAKTIADF